MKKLIATAFLAAILMGCSKKEEHPQWEYFVYEYTPDSGSYSEYAPNEFDSHIMGRMLNLYGKEGWELVSACPISETLFPNFGNREYVTGLRDNTKTQCIKFIFKRKKIEQPKKDSDATDSVTAIEEPMDTVYYDSVAPDTGAVY